MAIDFGDARTGIAVSDETATLTGDAWVIKEKRQQTLAKIIIDEAKVRGVKTIVVGFPKNMDGTVGFRASASEAFATELSAQIETNSPDVILWDERLTTKMADRILINVGKKGKKKKSSVDAVAASLILESYLASI